MKKSLYTYSFYLILLVYTSCTSFSPLKVTNQKSKFKNDDQIEVVSNPPKEMQDLLEDLNDCVAHGGDYTHPIDSIKSKGESQGRFFYIKKEILKTQYGLRWDKDQAQYILVQKIKRKKQK